VYTTVDTVKAKLGTFKTLILGNLEDTDLEDFIADADNTIDGYIAAAVTLPFASVPPLISTISTHITVRNLWAIRQAKDLPDHVKTDYENSLKLLNQISRGSIKLSAADPESSSFYDLKYEAATRVFGTSI